MVVASLAFLCFTGSSLSGSTDDSILSEAGVSEQEVCIAIETHRAFTKCLGEGWDTGLCPTNFANFPRPEPGSSTEIRLTGGTVEQFAFALECLFLWKATFPEDEGRRELARDSWRGKFKGLSKRNWHTVDGKEFSVVPDNEQKQLTFVFVGE